MEKKEFTLYSESETEALGKKLANALVALNKEGAFIAMRGEMGVGKTVFARGFGSALGIKNVKSPTYSILNEYRGKYPVYHFDMYRIEDEDGLYSIGYDDYLTGRGFIICEWSENIDEFIPKDAIFVEIRKCEGDASIRKVTVSGIEI
jgi:tRNA threonylcarbamoyladenosine biosynthesis protein TsaE